MKMITVKKEQMLPQFDGVNIEYTWVDGNCMGVKISQGDKLLNITKGESYVSSLSLQIEKPPVVETKWVVTGTNRDGETKGKTFDKECYADYYVESLNQEGYTTIKEQRDIIVEE